jgi:hypothetical protein
MGKRSNFERRERDFYPTPFSAVFPLIKHLKKGDTFSEPCCGQNDLVQHLQFYNFMCTSATDIDRGFDLFNIKPHDFSVISSKYFITNPPWPQASVKKIVAGIFLINITKKLLNFTGENSVQRRKDSFFEQVIRTFITFFMCSSLTVWWVPYYGIPQNFFECMILSAPYICLSITVGYIVRRFYAVLR